jgi:lipopolysaccharide/colanic/teichoic acid biosynthesis glycosyltransferase
MPNRITTDITENQPDDGSTSTSLGRGIPRPVEVALAVLVLTVSAPLIAAAALAVVVTSRGPAIFRQERMGRGGLPFVLYKLRTMQAWQFGIGVTSGDDARITRVGKLLRKTKVDELPELWNVIRGDMSLCGPRPEVPKYVDLENPEWRLLLRVRPGVTDPVTMLLRNEEALLQAVEGDRERFYLEILQPLKLRGYAEYLKRRTWQRDLRVLWQSGVAVILPGKAQPPTLSELLAERLG